MEEEMRANDKVFLLGEEVAQYNGAYKVREAIPLELVFLILLRKQCISLSLVRYRKDCWKSLVPRGSLILQSRKWDLLVSQSVLLWLVFLLFVNS